MTDTVQPATEAPAAAKTMLDVNDIQRILPHRFPFLLIDRVVDLTRRERIVAIKNVTINEPFFAGHFPISLLCRAYSSWKPSLRLGERYCSPRWKIASQKLMVFTSIEKARFRRPVVPGDQLRLEVEVKSWHSATPCCVRMEGAAYVGDTRVAQATVTCRLVRTRPEDSQAHPRTVPVLDLP